MRRRSCDVPPPARSRRHPTPCLAAIAALLLPTVSDSPAIARSIPRSSSGSPNEAANSLANALMPTTTFLTTHLPRDPNEGDPTSEIVYTKCRPR